MTIDENTPSAPSESPKRKTPFYKNWVFWFVVCLFLTVVGGQSERESKKPSTSANEEPTIEKPHKITKSSVVGMYAGPGMFWPCTVELFSEAASYEKSRKLPNTVTGRLRMKRFASTEAVKRGSPRGWYMETCTPAGTRFGRRSDRPTAADWLASLTQRSRDSSENHKHRRQGVFFCAFLRQSEGYNRPVTHGLPVGYFSLMTPEAEAGPEVIAGKPPENLQQPKDPTQARG